MTDGIESLGRVRAQGVLLLAVAFIVGGLAGAALDRLYVTSRQRGVAITPEQFNEMNRNAAENRAREERGRFERENQIPAMFATVPLTDEQKQRLRGILQERRPETDSIWRQLQPRIRALELDTRQRMLCVLTPDQRRAWADERNQRGLNAAETNSFLEMANAGRCPR